MYEKQIKVRYLTKVKRRFPPSCLYKHICVEYFLYSVYVCYFQKVNLYKHFFLQL